MILNILRIALSGGEGVRPEVASPPGQDSAVGSRKTSYNWSNRSGARADQWVSRSSTKTVDNPVEKVFDSRVNAAVSLAFQRID